MPPLRSHRRDRRARAPKQRRRRNLSKFVPSADRDFAMTAKNFAQHVQKHRAVLGISERDADYLGRLVRRFRDALAVATNPATRTSPTIKAKNDARKEAERWVRMIGEKIRGDHEIDWSHKIILRVVGLGTRKTHRGCPQEPPFLQFIGSGDGVDGSVGAGNGSGVHVLKFFCEQSTLFKPGVGERRKARPDGAAGIELWAGFIPEGMHVPTSPQEYVQLGYGWPLFLRKFTASPVEARPPMPDRPTLIVYWARWVNNAGDTGRFCKTCVGRVEGWPKVASQRPAELPASTVHIEDRPRHALPAGDGAAAMMAAMHRLQANFLLVGTPLELAGDERGDDGSKAGGEAARLLEAG